MPKKKKGKVAPQDGGLSPKEIEQIKRAMRQIWQRSSYSRKLVIRRCTNEDGFYVCEQCKRVVPRIAVDHIRFVGTFDSNYLDRLFVSSTELQGLCTDICHKQKTREDLKKIRTLKDEKKV